MTAAVDIGSPCESVWPVLCDVIINFLSTSKVA